MANILSRVTGNFTAAGTWKTVESASELDSEAGTIVISTTNLDSSTFVLTNTACEGVALKLNARAASPTGTITVTVRNNTAGGLREGTLTVNVSDLPAAGMGWVFFKMTAFTPNGSDTYSIRCVCSSTGSQVTLYRSTASANNFSRKVITQTTQAPASGNHIVICGELTGAGAGNDITVTMDNTATTSWGPTVSGGPAQGVVVSKRGVLTWELNTSTAYYFKWKGVMLVCAGGIVNVGSGGGRMPASSSAVFEMDSAANLDTYIQVDKDGTFNCYGATKTGVTSLTADAAAAATNLTVGDTTGWQVSDKLAFTPTASSDTEYETKNVGSVGSPTAVTLSAGLTNAHSGTSPRAGYVLNLTRNIVFRGISTSLRGNFRHRPSAGATTYMEYVEFTLDKLGTNSTSQRCIDIQSISGAPCTIKYSTGNPGGSAAGNNNPAFYISGSAADAFTLVEILTYDWASYHIIIFQATSGTAWTITDCFGIRNTDNNAGFEFQDLGGTHARNKFFCGSHNNAPGILLNENIDADYSSAAIDGYEVAYSGTAGAAGGLHLGGGTATDVFPVLKFTNLKLWRSVGGPGLALRSPIRRLIIDTATFTGNGNGGALSTQSCGIMIRSGCQYLSVSNATFAGDSTRAQVFGICFLNDANYGQAYVELYNCTFGVASGIYVAHVSNDLDLDKTTYCFAQVLANKTSFSSTTVFLGLTATAQCYLGNHIEGTSSFLKSQMHGQATGDHRTFTPTGIIKTDTAIYHGASPSERCTPNNASYKLRSGPKRATIASGGTRTISVWVRKSSAGDGAAYTGSQLRLMLRQNDSIGITADAVLATGAAATGTWEQLSATVPVAGSASDDGAFEVYVDGDGTAGWFNTDDWAVS